MATFIFVHGAFQGGWVWRRVADLLRAGGHEVHTPTLAGCGYLGDEKVYDLSTYIANILDYIEFEELAEIILVAHSFAGMICGAVMMQIPERIRYAVFIDAVIPEYHRSFTDLAGEPFRLMLEKHRQQDGSVRPWPLPVFGVNGADAQPFSSRLRPFSHQAFLSPFPAEFKPDLLATSFITCHETTSPFIQRMAVTAAAHKWPLLTLNTGHCPMITQPRQLAQGIMILVGSGYDLQLFCQ